MNPSVKLDLGGIGKRNGSDGWWTVNVGWESDIDADITQPLPFPDGTIEYMLCSHTLEHLPCSITEPTLKMWCSKLVPHGVLEIIVPDAEEIVLRYARGEVEWLTVMNVLFGVPQWLIENPYNQHLYGFSPASLEELVERCGFRVIERGQQSWEHNYENESDMPYFGKFRISAIRILCQRT